MTMSNQKADVGTRPPSALTSDHTMITTAIARVRFQRSPR